MLTNQRLPTQTKRTLPARQRFRKKYSEMPNLAAASFTVAIVSDIARHYSLRSPPFSCFLLSRSSSSFRSGTLTKNFFPHQMPGSFPCLCIFLNLDSVKKPLSASFRIGTNFSASVNFYHLLLLIFVLCYVIIVSRNINFVNNIFFVILF